VIRRLGIGLYELARAFATAGIRIPRAPCAHPAARSCWSAGSTAAWRPHRSRLGADRDRHARLEAGRGVPTASSRDNQAQASLRCHTCSSWASFVMLMAARGRWPVGRVVGLHRGHDRVRHRRFRRRASLFGKHPMAPNHQSQEGSWGRLLSGSLIVGIAAGNRHGRLRARRSTGGAGVILGPSPGVVFATLGDLSESADQAAISASRTWAICWPGHGGLMDRLDSLIAVAPDRPG